MTWRQRLGMAWGSFPGATRRWLVVVLAAAAALTAFSFVGPPEQQLPAVLALLGLLVVAQIVILWSLWRQRPEVRQARRAYLVGDYKGVIRVLEQAGEEKGLDPLGQTLLGNAYRQIGRLEDSERVLRAACEAEPDAPFSAYGLGRTLLVQGRYAEASAFIGRALAKRGMPIIVADLAYAHYLAGQRDEAARSLAQAERLELDPQRTLMTRYLAWRLAGDPADEALRERLKRSDRGLEVLKAECDRFRETPYGAALAEDIAHMEMVLEGESA